MPKLRVQVQAPPAWATIPYTVASPRPEPFSFGFVVKKGSKGPHDGVLVHARAAVSDANAHMRASKQSGLMACRFLIDFAVGGIDGERATVCHGVSPIDDKVE